MNDSGGQSIERAPSTEGARLVTAALAEHGRWLRTVLAARGVERGALGEVLQEVAAEALRGAANLRDADKLASWLYRIAVTQSLLHRRRAGRRRKLVERYADCGAAPVEAVDDDPLAWLLAEEQQQLVRRAIAALPSRDAEILLLKYTEDWSYRQLANHMGVSDSAIEARLHRARGRMRAALARMAPDLMPQR
jgi:RNA polymerase sigma factor (sigma-70 family)